MPHARRKVLLSLDESRPSTKAFEWAMSHIIRDDDDIHILTVMPPINYTVYPVAPVATAAAVSAVTHQWEAQKRHHETQASEVISQAVQAAQVHYGVSRDRLELHALPGAGGASGVAETVVEYAKAKGVDLVVVGSRGLGSVKRSLMSFVGLGSVSDYVLHNATCPVVVVRYDEDHDHIDHITRRQAPRKICVACDDSSHSEASLQWALANLLRPQDQLHIVSTALPVPFPAPCGIAPCKGTRPHAHAPRAGSGEHPLSAGRCPPVQAPTHPSSKLDGAAQSQIMDEGGVAAVALESQLWRERQEESAAFADKVVARASEVAVASGVDERLITCSALTPNGGASEVGGAVCKYLQQQGADVVVLGSRGMGALKRSLLSFLGLGSVSDHCAHNAPCAVAIVKAAPAAPQAAH